MRSMSLRSAEKSIRTQATMDLGAPSGRAVLPVTYRHVMLARLAGPPNAIEAKAWAARLKQLVVAQRAAARLQWKRLRGRTRLLGHIWWQCRSAMLRPPRAQCPAPRTRTSVRRNACASQLRALRCLRYGQCPDPPRGGALAGCGDAAAAAGPHLPTDRGAKVKLPSRAWSHEVFTDTLSANPLPKAAARRRYSFRGAPSGAHGIATAHGGAVTCRIAATHGVAAIHRAAARSRRHFGVVLKSTLARSTADSGSNETRSGIGLGGQSGVHCGSDMTRFGVALGSMRIIFSTRSR